MASTSRVQQDSQLPSTSQSLHCNSFSIKNILNLSDEPAVKPVVTSNEAVLPIPQFPLVPHVVRPLVHNMNGGVSFLYGPTHWLASVQEFLPCPFASRFSRYFPGATPYLRRKRPLRKRKQRPLFSQQQVQTMEREFAKHRYVTEQRRSELAARLNLTETQVKTWFQNRRTKWRKESRDELETALMESKRRWKETAEESDKSGETTTAPSSTANSAVPVTASQPSNLFIDLDNFKLNLTKKG